MSRAFKPTQERQPILFPLNAPVRLQLDGRKKPKAGRLEKRRHGGGCLFWCDRDRTFRQARPWELRHVEWDWSTVPAGTQMKTATRWTQKI